MGKWCDRDKMMKNDDGRGIARNEKECSRNNQGKFVGCQGKQEWCCNTDAADETDRADGTDRAARLLWVTGMVIMGVEAVHGFIGGSILLLDNVASS